jgi:hypothetical protein
MRMARIETEIEKLERLPLNKEELQVVRKLISQAQLAENLNGVHKKRTIEAVLQGRRKNPLIVSEALKLARAELKKYNETIRRINNFLDVLIIK